jgi:hypothetical protein
MVTPVTQLANLLFVLFAVGCLLWLVLRFARRSTSPALLSRLSWLNRALAVATAFVAGLVGDYPPSFEEYLGGCLLAVPVVVMIAVWTWLRRTGRIGGKPVAPEEPTAPEAQPVSESVGASQPVAAKKSILLIIGLPLAYLVFGFALFLYGWDEWSPIRNFRGHSYLALPCLLVVVILSATPAIPMLIFRKRLLAHWSHRLALATAVVLLFALIGFEVQGRYTTVVYAPSARYDSDLYFALEDEVTRLAQESPAQACVLSREMPAFYRGKERTSNYLFRFGGGEFPVNLSKEDFQLVHAEPVDCMATLRADAETGYPRAQYHFGRAYDQGLGVPQNFQKAAAWYLKAAEQGDPDAQYNLGYSYANGEGVPRNYSLAASWYRKAADQGDAYAQVNLAVMYEAGRGVPQDYDQAVLLLEKAAEQNVHEAQYLLGEIYDRGRGGVSRNNDKALYWYARAANYGSTQARDRLVQLRDMELRAGCPSCAAPESP